MGIGLAGLGIAVAVAFNAMGKEQLAGSEKEEEGEMSAS